MSVLDAIGNTPLVEIGKCNPEPDRVRILAKLEGANPSGSIKDRIAVKMVKMGIEAGDLTPGKTVLEAACGNTGIGLAMVCSALGYKLALTMPEGVSIRIKGVLQALGAKVILTPTDEGNGGAARKALALMEDDPEGYFMPNRFENPYNFMAHYETTGPEIWQQAKGEITAFVAGMGTTGTLMGVSRYLKKQNREVKVIAVEPVLGHRIQGLKNMKESISPGIYEPPRIDNTLTVNDDNAFDCTRDLALAEGLFVGGSSGAALWGAIETARELPPGSNVVCIFPDRGDRYL